MNLFRSRSDALATTEVFSFTQGDVHKVNAATREARGRFDRDVAWSAFAMLVPIAIGLVGLPLLFKNVHQHVFTLFLLSFGAINFAPSLDLGVARTAQRRIAYAISFRAETRIRLVHHSLWRSVSVSTIMAIMVMAGAAALFPNQGSSASRIALIVVTGVGVGLAIYANCQRGVLEGLGAFSRSALNRAAAGLMLISAPLLVSFFIRDAAALVFAALLVRVPFVLEQQRAIRIVLSSWPRCDASRDDDLTTGFMRESGWFALLSVLAVGMSGFDRYIMIGWGGLSGQPLTTFLAAQDLALRAIAVPTALLPALIVRLAADDENPATRLLAQRLFLLIVPGVILGCIAGALSSRQIIHILYPLLPLEPAAATLRCLFLGIAASAIAQFPQARLVAKGRSKDAALMHLLEFIAYLAVVPSLISNFGALGGATLWSGRIILDATLLILWSALIQHEKALVVWESGAMVAALSALLLIGFSA